MAPPTRLSAHSLRSRKVAAGFEPLVMVTAYDHPGARQAGAAGVDLILVGDSVAMVVLGYEDTLQVTVPDMVHHVAAVARARPPCMVVADMPWISYHLGPDDTVRNGAALIRAGAEAVKLEGGRRRVAAVEALVGAEIPVVGHIGLTPQSVRAIGGYRVQASQAREATALLDEAKALEEAGCVALVLECVPDAVAAAVTRAVSVPTIGIGAGPGCDGQVLVFHDLLGLGSGHQPRFVRRYAELGSEAVSAIGAYAEDVRAGRFPAGSESYHLSDEVAQVLGLYR